MPFLLILIGAIIIMAAWNGTQGDLVTALETDIPPFIVWALAIVAVAALGYVPGLQKPSRYLLALVLVAIVLKNYQQAIAGFTALRGATSPGTTNQAQQVGPAASYLANPSAATVTTAQVTGTSTGNQPGTLTSNPANINANTGNPTAIGAGHVNPLDPATYLQGYGSAFIGGF